MRVLLAGMSVALLVCLHPALAVDPEHLQDPALEARYQALIHELRCVQCEDNTLADSDAPIAADLRRQIRGMLLAGRTDQQIRDYYVSRYSEFILFKPRWSLRNAWLWGLPAVLLAIGAVVAVRILRARAALVDHDDDPAGSRT
jgi:cytochrome c-type biogenesis protein CcmH